MVPRFGSGQRTLRVSAAVSNVGAVSEREVPDRVRIPLRWSQVMREVAVLDKINPGGAYSTRVRRVAQFADAHR